MKKADLKLINARNVDLQTKINEARYLEELEMNGNSPESIIGDVKKALKIDENMSVIAESEEKIKVVNKLQKNFIDTNSLTQRLLDDKLIEEDEVAVLNKIESRIAEQLLSVYDLDLEDLYLEEGNE